MKEVYIKSQKDFDKLVDKSFNDELKVIIQTTIEDNLVITKTSEKWYVIIDSYCYVREMRGSSQVRVMRESSQVGVMRGSSQVREMRGSSQVGEMRGSSQVREMRGSSQVGVMRGSSQVKKLLGYASILFIFGSSFVNSLGYNTIRYYDTEKNINISKNKNTTVIKLPTIQSKTNLDMYLKLYPIEKRGKNLIFYKAVHKKGDRYISDYNNSFEYKIGEAITETIDKDKDNSCSRGIHISDKSWAISFGISREDMVLLECSVDSKDIIISKDCDGKVRTSKIKVLREVPKEERYI